MGSAQGVQVDWPSIRKLLRANEGTFVLLLVDLDGVVGCPPEVLTQINEAVDLANDAMVDDEGIELAASQGPGATPLGAFIDLDWPGGTEDDTQAWLGHLADTLTSIGHTGTIQGARRTELPTEIGNSRDITPALYLAYELNVPLAPIARRSWLIDDAFADQLCTESAAWLAEPGGDFYFSEIVFPIRTEAAAIPALLAAAVSRSGSAWAVSATNRPVTGRAVAVKGLGSMTFKVFNDPKNAAANAATLRSELLRHAESLDIGIIRPTHNFALGWGSLGDSRRQLPRLGDVQDWVLNRHMWSRFVPDAHAIQVLTSAHLDRANDLSNWDVMPVDNGRYLVETRDLDGWFANNGDATDAVITQARADFGDMIITTHDIEADPYGWLGGPRPPERA